MTEWDADRGTSAAGSVPAGWKEGTEDRGTMDMDASKRIKARLKGTAPKDVHSWEMSVLGWKVFEILRERAKDCSGRRLWPNGVVVEAIETEARKLGLLKAEG